MKKKKAKLDLLINSIFILLYFILTIGIISCKNISESKRLLYSNNNNDTIIFKNWLKDTLSSLRVNQNNRSFKTYYKVYPDSTLLDVIKIYDTILNKKKSLNNKDLILANELIKENNENISNKFNLKLEVIHSYSVPFTKDKYDYYLEIKHFEINYQNKKIIYNYIKGNLISRKEIKIPTK